MTHWLLSGTKVGGSSNSKKDNGPPSVPL